jgi:hypothetical protein
MIRHFIRWLYRSAITGRFVSREEAKAHPDTTTRERVRDEGDVI